MELFHLELTLIIARVCRVGGDKFSAPVLGTVAPRQHILDDGDEQVLVAAVVDEVVQVPCQFLLVLNDSTNFNVTCTTDLRSLLST